MPGLTFSNELIPKDDMHVGLKMRCFMPGLTFIAELISRSEGLHAELTCLVYNMLQNRFTANVANDIVSGAVTVERQFHL